MSGPAQTTADLHGAIEVLPDAVMLFDREYRLVYANGSARRISHVEPEHFGVPLWKLYPHVLGTNLEQVYRAAMDEGRGGQAEGFYYPPFDTWFDVYVLPTPSGVMANYREISSVRAIARERDRALSKLQQVFDATSDGILCINREWRITFINRRANQLLAPAGELDDLLGSILQEAFPATGDGSLFAEHYGRTMHDRVPSQFEAFYPEPLNAWYNIESQPAADGIAVFFRDITEEKKQREALRESEERYRVLTELSPQALWMATADGRVMYANKRFLEYIGRNIVPETGDEYLLCFDPDDRERVAAAWKHAVHTGTNYDVHARLVRANDGAARWCHVRALPLRDEEGNITQWLGMANDVHESRMTEATLRGQYEQLDKQSRMLEAIYHGSPIGMALYEPDTLRLIHLNERQADILGLKPEDAIGRPFEELVPLSEPRELLKHAANGKPMLNCEVGGVLPDRPTEYRYWNLNYSPIFDEDGKVTAVAGATIELTQQKRAETALIQNEKLAAVGRLASSISHEINNPLEAITNLLYLVSGEELSAQVRHYIETAQEELRRVSQIATQTLRFHRQSEHPTDVVPSRMVDAVMNLYQGRLANSGIQVERRYRTDKTLHCFENDMRQVLNNLIANAVDAMRGQGGRLIVAVELRHDLRGRERFAITVADTGAGMSPDVQSRLFEPFYTTKGLNGTGLGLWISKGIVERHHGTIRVRSRVGQNHGTVFQISLPCDAADPIRG